VYGDYITCFDGVREQDKKGEKGVISKGLEEGRKFWRPLQQKEELEETSARNWG